MKRLFVVISMKLTIIIVLISFALASCGGGGGGGGSQLPSIPLKTSNLRILQPNDSWTYNVTGTYSEGSSTYSVTGTLSGMISTTTITAPVNNTVCNIEIASFNLKVNNVTNAWTTYTYFKQDVSGNYNMYGGGEDNKNQWITTPGIGYVKDMASPVTVGDSLSDSITFDNGDSWSVSDVVAAKEYVSTSIANFESYKINITEAHNYATGTITKEELHTTTWVVPGLYIVKQDTVINQYAGSTLVGTLNISMTLTGTNVSY